ncbi:MAG: CBS domain-containing protein [bacterium]
MKVQDILKVKGSHTFTIDEDFKLGKALEIMSKNNIGSLVVLNSSGQISGLITEKEILHLSFRNPDGIHDFIIKDVISKQTIIVEPDDDVEYVEMVMTGEFIRHLPVVKDNRLVGLISIGDIVKSLTENVQHENKYLRDYINGRVY